MKNLDTIQQERQQIFARMRTAVQDNDQEGYFQAVDALADSIQQAILPDAREWQRQQDNSVLAARGCRVLTSEETEYYQKLVECWKAPDPKMALTNFSVVLPKTVIDSIFDDIATTHPLLDAVQFTNTEALVKMLMSTGGAAATWGAIDAAYATELAASFVELDLTLCSLLAYIPVARYMLDMGPQWVDRYVRTLLSESVALGLEEGLINGDGKKAPIGMTRKLSGAVDGVYPVKTATTITDLSAATYGTLLATLSQGPNNKTRAVPEVLLVVNPADYFTKVFPATTVRTTDGGWNRDVFPYPTRVVICPSVASGKAVFGIARQYFMGIGGGNSGGKIEYDDSVKFLERQRMYGVHLYGYGRAKTENDFLYLDISGLTPTTLEVKVVNTADVNVTNAADFPGGT